MNDEKNVLSISSADSGMATIIEKIESMDTAEIEPVGLPSDNMAVRFMFSLCALGLLLFTYYSAAISPMPAFAQRAIHLSIIFALAVFIYPSRTGWFLGSKNAEYILNIALVIVGVLAVAHLVSSWRRLYLEEMGLLDQLAALAVILITLEVTRRTIGMTLIIIVFVGVVYAVAGPHLPDIIAHRGYSLSRILSQIAAGTEGLFGSTLGIASTYVAGFIFFASFLEAFGGLRGFMRLAMSLAGGMTGGPAKISVVGSGFFAMISGSTVANVVSTGSITIPLMKNMGYPKAWAGAVEAVASTGGTFTPPIMGATAFILAEFLGVPYLDVMKAAAIPAFLYYAGFFASVHAQSAKQNFMGLSREYLPDIKDALMGSFHLLFSIVLLVVLLVKRFVAIDAALYASILLFATAFLTKESRPTWQKIVKAAKSASKAMVVVSSACATAGVVIAVLNMTGLGFKLSSIIVTVSGGRLLVGLLLTQAAAVILGMGLVTPATYALLAVLVAPGLVNMGVTPMAAHMFVFFCAALAPITPPVALAAYAAAGLADASPFKVGFNAVKMGIVAFVLPYFFVYSPSLLGIGTTGRIMVNFLTALIGVVALGFATQGYAGKHLSRVEQLLLFSLGFLLIVPHRVLSTAALAGLVVFWFMVRHFRMGARKHE
ncbi:MAG: TRAP transporter permease [Thermovirgaceae bacterium]